MILSGKKIKEQIEKGYISITPFDEKQIGPNSCNLTLHNQLVVYDLPKRTWWQRLFGIYPENSILDMKKNNPTKMIEIPEEGLILEPGKLYLGRTVERTHTDKYVPMLEGRSSIGRLSMFVHITAGFGDVGFNGRWTLEIACLHPIRIYPWTEICQIYYHTIDGNYDLYNSNKYQGSDDIVNSRMYMDFQPK